MSRYVKDSNGNWQLSAGVPQIDGELDITSENPVQNKAIFEGMSPMLNVLGAKNLLQNQLTSQTISGVEFRVNTNGSIILTGTATAPMAVRINKRLTLPKGTYILSGGIHEADGQGYPYLQLEDGTVIARDLDGQREFTLDSDTTVKAYIWVNNTSDFSSEVIYPMIRLASIKDDTYAPYSMTNQELTGEVEPMLNVLGAKNLLLSAATTQTVGEVTFTVDPEKRIVATNSVITTAQSGLNIVDGTVASLGLEAGEYIVSVGNGLNPSSYVAFFGIWDGSSWVRGAWLQESPNFEYKFSITDAILNNSNYTVTFYVRVESNVAAGSSHTFLPMIRPASVADNTYVPYAMTNRELTDASSVSLGYGIYLRKLGRMRIIDTSNSSESFPSAGISLGENVKNPAFGVCIYTKGSLQTGFLYVATDNKLHLFTNVCENTDGTYVNGQVIYYV